eukprot:2919058-Amphidinium_carterae.1
MAHDLATWGINETQAPAPWRIDPGPCWIPAKEPTGIVSINDSKMQRLLVIPLFEPQAALQGEQNQQIRVAETWFAAAVFMQEKHQFVCGLVFDSARTIQDGRTVWNGNHSSLMFKACVQGTRVLL